MYLKCPKHLKSLTFLDTERWLGGTWTERINNKYSRLNFHEEFISKNVFCQKPSEKQYSEQANHFLSIMLFCLKDIVRVAAVEDNRVRYLFVMEILFKIFLLLDYWDMTPDNEPIVKTNKNTQKNLNLTIKH